MFGRWRRNFHPQNDTPGCAKSAVGAGVMMVLYVPAVIYLARLGAPFWQILPVFLLVLGVSTTVMMWVMNGTLRTGISTDREGLCEHFWLKRRRRVPWAEITSVEQSDQSAVVHHSRGELRLEPPLADWAQLGAMAQRHLSGEPPVDEDEVHALPPEEVAAWLGIARDGELVDRSAFHRWATPALIVWFVLIVVGFKSEHVLPAFLLEMAGIVALLASGLQGVIGGRRHRHRRVREVRATADGLEAHSGAGWQRYAWGGLKSLRRIGVFWVVTSTDGDLWLPPGMAHRERLLHAVRQAIAARGAGFSLPRMSGEVPAAALSRAQATVSDERGVSRAEADSEV